MAQLTVKVNDRSYHIACEDGEEQHVTDLAAYVEKRVESLVEQVGQIGEGRLLLMAALTIADELSTAYEDLDAARDSTGAEAGQIPAAMLTDLANRIETVAADLGNA